MKNNTLKHIVALVIAQLVCLIFIVPVALTFQRPATIFELVVIFGFGGVLGAISRDVVYRNL